jgi:C1A family cysteine protease
VLLAISVCQSFETSTGGVILLPSADDIPLGGHEMCVVGYNDSSQTFEVQNSWGSGWGDAGFCHIPYSYIQNSEWCYDLSYFML